jgi:hypothetical protein|tara:strand:- start:686 stop:862 length:177 start_codon:yes stop_codon:yes gene_type:complete
MKYTEVNYGTMLRITDETGQYIEKQYIRLENGQKDIEATKQYLLDHYNLMKKLEQYLK